MADFGPQDGALVLALARGLTVRAAAAEAEIGERTAHRRLADPGFRRRVSVLRGELMDAAAGRLADGATAAADALRELLDSEADTTRLAAARTILQQSVALRGPLTTKTPALKQSRFKIFSVQADKKKILPVKVLTFNISGNNLIVR